jgi:hypothetical protein
LEERQNRSVEEIRKPYQGVWDIVRFNWHFYVLAFTLVFGLFILNKFAGMNSNSYIFALIILILATIFISLLVSFYVYDLSGLYRFNWLTDSSEKIKIVNINAGFDETSTLIKTKFRNAELLILDFYDPIKHTEVSIKRARNAYPPFPGTKQISTSNLMQADNSIDKIFATFAAHEIRDEKERSVFFKELNRILKPDGEIFLTEHLRNSANFLAYNIGFFHFFSKANWFKIFNSSKLTVKEERTITPFITVLTLKKNGVTS